MNFEVELKIDRLVSKLDETNKELNKLNNNVDLKLFAILTLLFSIWVLLVFMVINLK